MRFLAYFSLFFMIFTSLVGIHTLVNLAVKRLFDKKGEISPLKLLPVKGESEELEYIIRTSLVEDEQLTVIDCGLSEQARAAIWRMKEDNPKLLIITSDLLKEYVEGLQHN